MKANKMYFRMNISVTIRSKHPTLCTSFADIFAQLAV